MLKVERSAVRRSLHRLVRSLVLTTMSAQHLRFRLNMRAALVDDDIMVELISRNGKVACAVLRDHAAIASENVKAAGNAAEAGMFDLPGCQRKRRFLRAGMLNNRNAVGKTVDVAMGNGVATG
jgi:hypothetical protein